MGTIEKAGDERSLGEKSLVHNHSYGNELNLHMNEISFLYERMGTKTRFKEEAKGNSEMAYCPVTQLRAILSALFAALAVSSEEFAKQFQPTNKGTKFTNL